VNSDPNPEIRSRCAGLLPKATSLEMKARLEVFLADAENRYEHDLPGWNQFRATVCRDWTMFGYIVARDRTLEKAARTAFVELISTPMNKCVVMATGGSQTELNSVVIARRQELYNLKFPRPVRGPAGGGFVVEPNSRRDPTTEDIAALLFAETLAPQTSARVIPRAATIFQLINTSGFTSQIRDTDEKGRVFKAILVSWLESRINPNDLLQGMNVASQLGLSESSLRMSARLFTTQGTPPIYRGTAVATLARSGSKEHIPLIEKALDDTAILTLVRETNHGNGDSENANQEIQIRDVALALSIQLAGGKPEDYGFTDQFDVVDRTMGLTAGNSFLRYIPNEKRAAAFEKWKEWWANNKDK
jgi:hypothetical protein